MAINPYIGTFQLTGAVSGMDTGAMVEKLMEIEQQPLLRAQEKFDTLQYKQKLWMEVDNKLEDFYDSLINFKLKGNLIPKSAVSSDETILTASARADAADTTFYLKVNSLASQTVLLGEGIDSSITKKSSIGDVIPETDDLTATFTINKGSDSVEITVSDGETIQDLINKINESSIGVEAKFDDKNGKFFLINKENGDIDISVSAETGSNGEALLASLNLNGTPDIGDDSTSLTLGSYAEVELSFNGSTSVTTYSNLKENTLDIFDTTVNLESTSSNFVKVSVEQDIDKSVEAIKEFVDKYNETITYIYELLREDKVTGKAEDEMTEEDYMKGMLKGDRNLEKIFYNLRNMVYSSTNISDSQYTSLFQIGISSGDFGSGYENTMKGLLSVDEDKLREALSDDAESVWKLFATNDKDNNKFGYAQSIQNYLFDVTKFNGYIDQVSGTNGTIGNEMRRLAKEMTSLLERLQRKEARYYAQFSAMEQAMLQLNMQGMYIQNAFSNNS